jgi:hypothetical protein
MNFMSRWALIWKNKKGLANPHCWSSDVRDSMLFEQYIEVLINDFTTRS